MDGWVESIKVSSAIAPRTDPLTGLPLSAGQRQVGAPTCVNFDVSYDLLWTGDSKGTVASYNGVSLSGYTRFHVGNGPVNHIETTDRNLITLCDSTVKVYNRRGIVKHTIQCDELQGCTTFCFGSRASEIIVAGESKYLVRINLDKGTVSAVVERQKSQPTAPASTLSTSSSSLSSSSKKPQATISGVRYISRISNGSVLCLGLTSGKIDLVDGHSFKPLSSVQAHSGAISDMCCRGPTLATCGTSYRKQGYVADPLVNLYDIRNASRPRFLTPVAVPLGARFVRMHPKMSSQCIIVCNMGQLQFVDLDNPAAVQIRQLSIGSQATVTAMAMSPSGDYLAFTDDSGLVHLWTCSASNSHFTEFPTSLEYPVDQMYHGHTITENDPLSSIGMPYYKNELLSSWNFPGMKFSVGLRGPVIPAKLQSAATPALVGNVASYHKELYGPRNSNFSKSRRRRSSASVPIPRFLSERQRSGISDKNDLFDETFHRKDRIPKIYRKLLIKYSKFGVNDFDFDYYNKTSHSGLETQVANAYCNALLQIFRWSKRIYNFSMYYVAEAGAASADRVDLLCELGFLFDMLCKASGRHCRATNFVNALKSVPAAASLGLLVDEDTVVDYLGLLAQSFCKFLMEQITRDELKSRGRASRFGAIAGSTYTLQTKCLVCGSVQREETTVTSLDMPRYFSKESFSSHLFGALDQSFPSRGLCTKCNQQRSLHCNKQFTQLAPVLILNINLTEKRPQREILQRAATSQVRSFEPLQSFVDPLDPSGRRYQLLGVVVEVTEPEAHLVSIIKIDKGWYLFNDFLVAPLSEEAALDFSVKWKTPVLLIYEKNDNLSFDYDGWKERIDKSILYNPMVINNKAYTPSPLRADEKLHLIAIDAEFVMLQHEEKELRSDGSKSVLKPQSLSLARVSVVRGEGPEKGVPFIDDFVATEDQIVDYLTQFSGIEPGDLDPAKSSKGLVKFQTAYRRLWVLLNLGCVFVGHGLLNDFRTINIQVPQKQVIDTLDIYFVAERQRRLSLKFLAWSLLATAVQTGNHDSVEDAITALQLYDKYLDLSEKDEFDKALKSIYQIGNKYNFRVPESQSKPSSSTVETPTETQ